MKKSLLFGLGLSLTLSGVSFAQEKSDEEAAQSDSIATINWLNPKDYADVRAANESRSRFSKRVFNRLDEYFNELAEELPEGHTIDITVNDLDLAGQVWPAQFVGLGHSTGDVRLIKRVDIPRIKFSYVLKNNGNVVKEAEVNLKDMGFLDRLAGRYKSDPLRYEKRMLNDWFSDEFSEQIAKN